MASRLTRKGQVTIPKRVRAQLGAKLGDLIDFGSDGRIILLKADRSERTDRLEALRGIAGPGPSTEEIMALTRGE